MTRKPIAFAFALALFVGHAARADECTKEQKAASKLHFEEGAKAFRLNTLPKAADSFKAAYDACPLPLFLYNLGQTYRQLKDNDQALYFYKQFLSSVDASDSRRHDVEQWIAQINEQIENQRRIQQAPPPGPASPSSSTDAAHAASAMSDIHASADRSSRRLGLKLGLGLSTTGVMLVGVAAGLLGVAVGERDKAQSASTQVDFDTHHDRSIAFQQAGWPLLGVGSALVVGGVVVLTVKARGEHR